MSQCSHLHDPRIPLRIGNGPTCPLPHPTYTHPQALPTSGPASLKGKSPFWTPKTTAHCRPPDPIIGVTDAFKKDTSPNKVNLGVGTSLCPTSPLLLTPPLRSHPCTRDWQADIILLSRDAFILSHIHCLHGPLQYRSRPSFVNATLCDRRLRESSDVLPLGPHDSHSKGWTPLTSSEMRMESPTSSSRCSRPKTSSTRRSSTRSTSPSP